MPKAKTPTQTYKTSELHRNLVSIAVKAGLEDNSDLVELYQELTSSDKLRGVKASSTLARQNVECKAKPCKPCKANGGCAKKPQAKKKPAVTRLFLLPLGW